MKDGMDEEAATEKAKAEAPLIKEAHEMLVKWENNDPEVRALWQKMNSWVYAGFDETYKMMGVGFDKIVADPFCAVSLINILSERSGAPRRLLPR